MNAFWKGFLCTWAVAAIVVYVFYMVKLTGMIADATNALWAILFLIFDISILLGIINYIDHRRH